MSLTMSRKLYSFFVKLLLAFVVLLVLLKKLEINFQDIFGSVVNYQYFILAILFPSIVTTSISANRWKTFLSMIGVKESFFHLVSINFISTFWGILMPSSQGFDVLRIYAIERCHPNHRGQVGSTVLVERILGLLCLFVIAGCSSLFINNFSLLPILIFSFLIVLLCLFIFNKTCYEITIKFINSIPYARRVFRYLSKLYVSLHFFPFNKKIYWSIFLIFLLQLSNILVVSFLFDACGYHIDFFYHLCYQPVISVITMIPLTFGGIGLREGGFALFYINLGIPNTIIISVSLLYYVVISIIPALLGGFIYLSSSYKKLRKE